MATFISEYFNLDNELEELEVFDAVLDGDSNFFINLVRLKNTKVQEFKTSYKKINFF